MRETNATERCQIFYCPAERIVAPGLPGLELLHELATRPRNACAIDVAHCDPLMWREVA